MAASIVAIAVHTNPVILVPLAVLCAGCGLFALALRGRRVDDHPLCRRCGFDLFGKPDTSTKCSECGAVLDRKRAVRIGHRKRRGRMAALALVPMLLCGSWLGALAWGTAKGVNWNVYKPCWALEREIDSNDAAASGSALTELTRRIRAGTLSDQQLAEVTDHVLTRQADLQKSWSPPWSTLIETARDAGRLPDEKWQRYARQAVLAGCTLRAAPVLALGEPLTLVVDAPPQRGGELRFITGFKAEVIRVDGRPLHLGSNLHLRRSYQPSAHGRRAFAFDWWSAADSLGGTTAGKHALQVRIIVAAVDNANRRLPPIVADPVNLSSELTLAPCGSPPVALITDPALRPAIEKTITVRDLCAGRPWSSYGTVLTLDIAPLPVPIAMRVLLRWPQHVRTIGRFSCIAHQGGTVALSQDEPLFLTDVVDVILRPDAKEMEEIKMEGSAWGQEIVIRDVPVRRVGQ